MWEVVGTETGSVSGREGERDHPVPEDSQETVIPVSCRGFLPETGSGETR